MTLSTFEFVLSIEIRIFATLGDQLVIFRALTSLPDFLIFNLLFLVTYLQVELASITNTIAKLKHNNKLRLTEISINSPSWFISHAEII